MENKERNLWASVMEQAINDYRNPKGPSKDKSRIKRSAKAWLKSSNNTGIYTFLGVCSLLNFNPEAVREKLFI